MAWAWPGWGWRGRGWWGPWPGRGPFSYLPPWLRPGWLFGRGACWWLFGYPWAYGWGFPYASWWAYRPPLPYLYWW